MALEEKSVTYYIVNPTHPELVPLPFADFEDIVNTIKSLVSYAGKFAEASDEASSSLVMVIHPFKEVFVDLSMLHFYHDSLGGLAKKVLVLNAGPNLTHTFDYNYEVDWLFIIDIPLCLNKREHELFSEWLKRPLLKKGRTVQDPVQPKEWKNILCRFLAQGESEQFNSFFNDLVNSKASKIQERYAWFVLKDASCTRSEYYYALSLLCSPSLINHHRTEKVLGSGFSYTDEPYFFNQLYKEQKLLEACGDLQSSLAFPLYPPKHGQGNILIIDDRPEDYEKTLLDMLKCGFFNKHQIWLWRVKKDDMLFKYLETYNSTQFQYFQTRHAPLIRCLESEETSSLVWCQPTSVKKGQIHIGMFQFLVVDLLYQWNSENVFMGPGVIKGLTRGLGDLLRTNHSNRVPEIIALSRTSDPEVIQEAIRCGARGYVLKPNLLKLPSVLARIQEQSRQPHHYLQSNFKKLYHLPKETIGLLKSCIIPPEPALDTPPHALRRDIIKAEKILKSIPKAELHCHIGSCMSQEFLLVASLVGLVQRENTSSALREALGIFHRLLDTSHENVPKPILLLPANGGPIPEDIWQNTVKAGFLCSGVLWFKELAAIVKRVILSMLTELELRIETRETEGFYQRHYNAFRSLLHEIPGLEDYLERNLIKERVSRFEHDLVLSFWWIRYAIGPGPDGTHGRNLTNDDLIRLYLLVLASRIPEGNKACEFLWGEQDILSWFREGGSVNDDVWQELHRFFYAPDEDALGCTRFRKNGWHMPGLGDSQQLSNRLHQMRIRLPKMNSLNIKDFNLNPIGYSIASGTRSGSLKEYLSGCEFTGSTHLRHPFLIHLFAQDLISYLQEQGHLYIELRGAPDGYTNHSMGFQFPDACQCLIEAFSFAQSRTLKRYEQKQKSPNSSYEGLAGQTDCDQWLPEILFENHRNGVCPQSGSIPVKISLILVGKRHKSLRQMILAAAAGGLFYHSQAESQVLSPGSFLEEMGRCRVVGFDLAGPEGEYPPGLFTREFSRLQKLHIPMTVHAGENAPHQFVEDAILELGAKRIGHALSMDGCELLMARACEERICVELCPVSNHQTCHFTPENKPGRTYPLKKFMEMGIPVCLNTDNPTVSDTTLIKEFFMASAAWGGENEGLSFWNALRLIKMGFRHAFLPMAQRRALLEIADQLMFDYFSKESIQKLLRELFHLQTQGDKSGHEKPLLANLERDN